MQTGEPYEPTKSRLRLIVGSVGTVAIVRVVLAALNFAAPNQVLNAGQRGSAAVDSQQLLAAHLQPLLVSGTPLIVCVGVFGVLLWAMLVRYAHAPPIFSALCLLMAFLFQIGFLVIVVLLALVLRPKRLLQYLRYGAVSGFTASIFWTLHTSLATSAAASLHLWQALTIYGLSYPLVTLAYHLSALPLTSVVLAGLTISTVAQSRLTVENSRVRLLLILAFLGFVALASLNVSLHSRYVLVFWPAIAVLLVRGLQAIDGRGEIWPSSGWRWCRRAAAVALAIGLAVEQYEYSRLNPLLLTDEPSAVTAVPRVNSAGWAAPLSTIPSNAVVASNDELACMYHVGRVDYWLAVHQMDLARFAVATNSGRYGLYGGGRVLSSFDALAEMVNVAQNKPFVLVLFETGRFDYEGYRQRAIELAGLSTHAVISEARGIFVLTNRPPQ
jgi:hypothetical protein